MLALASGSIVNEPCHTTSASIAVNSTIPEPSSRFLRITCSDYILYHLAHAPLPPPAHWPPKKNSVESWAVPWYIVVWARGSSWRMELGRENPSFVLILHCENTERQPNGPLKFVTWQLLYGSPRTAVDSESSTDIDHGSMTHGNPPRG